MSLWMTQSLLSSWLYFLNAEDAFTDKAYQSFLTTLRRERKETTKAMQLGIQFESHINDTVAGITTESVNEKWDKAVRRFAKLCTGGQPQVQIAGSLKVSGLEFTLYGICDYVKAGQIFDIKKVSRYEYGKYFTSPQHAMYLHLLPEAKRFDYLIFDGSHCFIETYRREDCKPIEQTISEFVRWLKESNLFEIYETNWNMNPEREEMIYGL